jgi:UDP-N-acetylmuramoyl-tripeptide--D-alanyl-D-alanine ligase
MIPMSAQQIADVTGGRLVPGAEPELLVTGPASIDSREIAPGGLFVAIAGEQVDGHDYAVAAAAAGAVLVLASRPVDGVPNVVLVDDAAVALAALARHVAGQLTATVIGVTGSSGKTSTKDLIAQVLGSGVVATNRSFNNELGLPLTVLRADEATRYLVLEMGARGPGHLDYLCQIAPPHIGAVINVGTAHVGEYPGGREQIALAKGELIAALPAFGIAVLNADDPLVASMASRTSARVLRWSLTDPAAEIYACGIEVDGSGCPRFTLQISGERVPVRLQLHGVHAVPNALAAAAVAHGLGVGVATIAERLEAAVRLSAGRMEISTRPDGVRVINDAFNANGDSMRSALATVAAMDAPVKVAVLGEMAELGDLARTEHEHVGVLAARSGLTRLIAVGDALAGALADAARAESNGLLQVDLAATAEDAERLLQAAGLGEGDVLLVKASHSAHLDLLAERLAAATA